MSSYSNFKTERRVTFKASKAVRFDPKNIQETHHPLNKDYGLLPIQECNTPWPYQADPVDSAKLRDRLLQVMRDFDINERNSDGSIDSSQSFSSLSSKQSLTFEFDAEKRKEAFNQKRKEFDAGEYTITRGQLMASEMHPPIILKTTQKPRESITSTAAKILKHIEEHVMIE